MAFNRKRHLTGNIAAIRTAFELHKSGSEAGAGEMEILKKYSGFGGLKCILQSVATEKDRAG